MSDAKRHQEFVNLLTKHQGQLFGYIYALVRNLSDAEDLFQQTSLTLWSKFDRFESGSNFVAWGCTTAQMLVLNFLKRKHRSPIQFTPEFQSELAAIQAEIDSDLVADRRDALSDCVKKLRDPDRDIVEACYGEGKQVAQFARELGRRQQSVHNSLRRIRKILLDCINRTLSDRERPQ